MMTATLVDVFLRWYFTTVTMSSTTLQLVAAFEFVILLLLLFDLTLTIIWLQPQKFFTNILNVVEVHQLRIKAMLKTCGLQHYKCGLFHFCVSTIGTKPHQKKSGIFMIDCTGNCTPYVNTNFGFIQLLNMPLKTTKE